ncbi:MAG: hypothetical protein KDJ22_07360 [Candidatus Competibacteraceae bacterium]|nr:hypothetical protein [Candidatus Competibacteraceae bacterium]MCP5127770.1 hypothetical protein [Gammaproteobacteria bacterium]HRX70128.1 DUF6129 family protein [Candidatus Competibacteraceae bacterium]
MITSRQLNDIAQWASTHGVDYAALSHLRQVYPNLYFTDCLDDDINDAEPVLQGEGVNVYLVDSRQHCLHLTDDPQIATGVVLAVTTECVDS